MQALPFAQRLLLSAGLGVAGLSASVAAQTVTLERLKADWTVYPTIVGGKDLIADILPTLLYLVDASMLANEPVIHAERAAVHSAQVDAPASQYDVCRSSWRICDVSDDLKTKLHDAELAKGNPCCEADYGVFVPAVPERDTVAVKAAGGTMLDGFQGDDKAAVSLHVASDACHLVGQNPDLRAACKGFVNKV